MLLREARCRIELFGGLRVTRDAEVITRFRTQKAVSLLAYLALHLRRFSGREQLIDLLWPDLTLDAGRNNLSTTLSVLRRQLEPLGVTEGSVLIADRQRVGLNAAAVSTDAEDFEHLLRAASGVEGGRRDALLRQALALYQGPLLPGCYDDWILGPQARCQEQRVEALLERAGLLEQTGQWEAALTLTAEALTADPYREQAYQAQMRLYGALGRAPAAQQTYETLARLLREQLGVMPEPATRELADRLRRDPQAFAVSPASPAPLPASARITAPPAPAAAPIAAHQAEPMRCPPPSAPDSAVFPVALPLQLTRFVGREQELARLREWLSSPSCRLVTLTGPGGAGKTRLAIEVAQQVAVEFAGRIWFAPLADLPDASLIPYALAGALKLPRASAEDTLARVTDALGAQPCLLILDNYEQLLRADIPQKYDNPALSGGAALIRMLLERVPGLTCLVTSRQPLRLGGEQEFALGPLPIPDADTSLPAEDRATFMPGSASPSPLLATIPSVALYLDRARAASPDFALTVRNADAVAALCRKLEGMPLAIEMAAAWAKTLTPQKMLERLEHQLDMLVSRRSDLPPRHQSLRATIAWSCALLTPAQQQFFARLSVFRGGWTLEAAEALWEEKKRKRGENPHSAALPLNSPPSTLNLLAQLQENSLLVAEETEAGTRYRMLETLREYGAEILAERGEEQEARGLFLAFFANMAANAERSFHGPEEKAWMAMLEAERDNLRAALHFCFAEGTGEAMGQAETGFQLVVCLGWFWLRRGPLGEARQWVDRALRHPARMPDLQRGPMLLRAGMFANDQGDKAAAREYFEQAIALAQQMRSLRAILAARNNLAIVAHDQGDTAYARACWEQNLEQGRVENNEAAIASALTNLGELAYDEGDYDRAETLLTEGAALHRRAGNTDEVGRDLSLLGKVSWRRQDLAQAESLLRESLQICQAEEYRVAMVGALEASACLATAQRQPERAARLLAAAEQARQTISVPRPANEARDFDTALADVRAALPPDALRRCWEEGQASAMAQACSYALAGLSNAPPAETQHTDPAV